ncbi:anti-anti-sigma regulatory factor [Thalassotalea insulae]|uniref:Anti-anti-sigma regulatory factor n=1 Tax=Thalassotalea insulae TaxID=2056778 RepID=A0ABQ6GQ41_9GAMM|nr:STAS domain-containing protein [Thalassotalea insulae]GLX76820.1 anti-anti-sigma regulatory factor [Thalassotalea insulae]
MSLQIEEFAGNNVTIAIEDRFDFSLHQQFREAYIHRTEQGVNVILDLSKTSYMDSSALGMILLLKDHIEQLSGTLKLVNPSDAVYKVLEIAQFQRLMTIER